MTGEQVELARERVEQEKRLDSQKVAVAWCVYALALGLLLLVSLCGLPPDSATPRSNAATTIDGTLR
jgi:hypothetical protein